MAILAATGWLAQASAQAAPDNSAPAASSDSSTPAPADSGSAPAKPAHKHHASSKGIHRGATTKGDAAVEDLNAQSLSAAKSGTAFKPATTPTPAKAPAKSKGKTMHHHKKAAPAADSSAPAADSSAPAPAPDSSGK
jgi:hypothetical protein